VDAETNGRLSGERAVGSGCAVEDEGDGSAGRGTEVEEGNATASVLGGTGPMLWAATVTALPTIIPPIQAATLDPRRA
jgi:hypothetical protein